MFRVKSDKSDWLRIRNDYSAHAQKIGPSQRWRFLVLTKRSAASGDENDFLHNWQETIVFEQIFAIEYFIFKLVCSKSEKSVKMRNKHQVYLHVVKSTSDQALSHSRTQSYGVKQYRNACTFMPSPKEIFTICRHTNNNNVSESRKEKSVHFRKMGC